MKSMRFLLLFATLVASVESAAPTAPATTEAGATNNVVVQTAVSELAAGYALAVSQMSLKSLVIYYQGDGKVVAAKGIRSAKALQGVRLVTFSSGDMMALNAERIVLITDGSRTPTG